MNKKEQAIDLSVDLNGLKLHNPITTASGTFGFGSEYSQFVDLNQVGAVCVKGLTLKEKQGNPAPRLAETPMGILNSVGLQNPGVQVFIDEGIPFLRGFNTKIIANINGNSIEDYVEMANILSGADVDSLELNISCPNVKQGGMAFGTDPQMVRQVVKEVRVACKKHLIVKLSPNVTNIAHIGAIAESEGADALSLINTLAGMAIDIHKCKPILANGMGGLSGPAVKPVAIKMVFDVAKAVNIPVLGMGGISTGQDAAEFFLAGATAIAVGTANFSNPHACKNILEDLEDYMKEKKFSKIEDIQNAFHTRK